MKLLFDENLSFRLVAAVADAFPGSSHVREIGLLGAPDEQIWAYALRHGYALVSKDTDFYQRSLVYGAPPKVIWLRVGNAPTDRVAALLIEHRNVLLRFDADSEASFLPLK